VRFVYFAGIDAKVRRLQVFPLFGIVAIALQHPASAALVSDALSFVHVGKAASS
jgi:hypothetical protein